MANLWHTRGSTSCYQSSTRRQSQLSTKATLVCRRRAGISAAHGNNTTETPTAQALVNHTSRRALSAVVTSLVLQGCVASSLHADTGEEPAKDPQDHKHHGSERRQRLKARDLAKILNVSEGVADALLTREPDLVHHPANRVQAALKRFSQAVKVDEKEATSLVLKQPRVLLVPEDQVEPRIKDLATLLKITDAKSQELVKLQPGLITHQHETLRARLAALVALIKEANAHGGAMANPIEGKPAGQQLSQQQGQAEVASSQGIAQPGTCAVQMARREPGLLAMSHKQVVSKIATLAAALGSPGNLIPALQLAQQAPTSLLLPASRIASIVATLATLLSISTIAAGQLLVRQPRLLTLAPEAITANLRGLASGLSIEREAAAIMATEQPGLLLLQPSDVPQRIKVLSQSIGASTERTIQLVSLKPGLLLKDPQLVQDAISAAKKKGELPK